MVLQFFVGMVVLQWEYLVKIPHNRLTDEIREHDKTKAQLERAEARATSLNSNNEQVGQELKNLRKEKEELKSLHPILKFYGTRAKIIRSFDLDNEVGSMLTIGNCSQPPCFVFTMLGRVEPKSANLGLSGSWDGIDTRGRDAFEFSQPLRKGCKTTLKAGQYVIDFVIEDSQIWSVHAGIGISIASSPQKGLVLAGTQCPEEEGTR